MILVTAKTTPENQVEGLNSGADAYVTKPFTPKVLLAMINSLLTNREKAKTILSLCNNMGEGWLLTAEMIELIESGTPNVVCAQPFACLPNHVVGKSVIKRLRQMYPQSNIVAVDYDPGASEVNQLNRIKLMISVAKENLREQGSFVLEGDDLDARGETSGPIHLSPEQLAQIEQAKQRAGVK